LRGGVEMKACNEIVELIAENIDGELDEESRVQVEEHLAVCQDCKREFEDMMYVVDLCRTLPEEELPEGFSEQLHERLVEEKSRQERINKVVVLRKRYAKIFSSIASVFLIMVLVKGFVNNGFLGLGNYNKSTQNQAHKEAAEFAVRQEADVKAESAPSEAKSEIASANVEPFSAKADASRGFERNTAMFALGDNGPNVIYSRSATIILISDNPDVQIKKLKNYANANGIEVLEDEYGYTLQETSPNEKTDEVLKIKVPYSSYEQFINSLITDFNPSSVEFGQENVQDMTAVIDELNCKLDELQNRINSIERNNGDISPNNEDLRELEAERKKIIDEIERIEMESDYIFITLLFKTN